MQPRSSRLGVEGIKSFNAKEESDHRETPHEHFVFSSTAAASYQQNNPATSNVNQLKLRAAASPPDAAGRASPEDMSTTHRRTLGSRALSTGNTSCSRSEIPHDSSRQQAGSRLRAGTSSSTNLAKHDQLEDDDSARESDPSARSTRRDQLESTHEAAAAAAAAYHMKFSIPELYLGAPLENLLEEEEESGGARKTTWQTERKLSSTSDHAGTTVLKSRVQSAGELLLHNNNPRLSASSWSHHHQQQQRSTVSDHDVGAASSYQQRTRPRSVSALEAAAADHSSPRHLHGLINNNRGNYTNPPSSGSGSAAGLHHHWSCISGPSFLQEKELLWRRRQQLPTVESPVSSSRAHHDPSPRAISVKEPAGNRAPITQWAGSNNNSLLQSISTAERKDSARTMMMFEEQLSAEMDQTQGHNHTASSSSPTPMCGSRPVDAATLQRKASTPTTTIPQMENIMMPIEGLKFVPTLVQSSSRSQQQQLVGTSSVATHSGDQAAAAATVRLQPRSWDSSKLLPQLQKHGNSLYNNNNPIPVANFKQAAAASSSIQKSQSLRSDYGARPLDDIFAAGLPHSSSSNSKFAMDSAGNFTSFQLRGKKKQNFSFDADDADVIIPRVGPRAAMVQKAMSMRTGGAHSDAITEMARKAYLNSQQAYSSNGDQLMSTHGEAQQRLLECAMCGKELGVLLVQSWQNHVQQDMLMGMSFCHTCRPPPSIGFQSLRHDPTASDSYEDPTAAPAALSPMMKNKNKTNKHNKNNKALILQFCRKMLGLDKKQK
ncbi:unnamed protein product [Sphagnum jensenii]|uniref:Uncharacterized protein n=1 Tax=Sphagnum jensenii TaxID=128206 RepID=A0ABP1A9W5_9BRYO